MAGFGLVGDFEDGQTEGSVLGHHRAVQENSAGRELLSKVEGMLLHQEYLLIGDVLGKGGARGNQLEEVMLFVHGEGNDSAGRTELCYQPVAIRKLTGRPDSQHGAEQGSFDSCGQNPRALGQRDREMGESTSARRGLRLRHYLLNELGRVDEETLVSAFADGIYTVVGLDFEDQATAVNFYQLDLGANFQAGRRCR